MPNDIDVLTWSLPFLAEKVTDLLFNIVGRNADYSPKSQKELDDVDFKTMLQKSDRSSTETKEARRERLRNKVRSVARMARMFKNLKEHSEQLVLIKAMSVDGKIPRGLLMSGLPAIKHTLKEFELSKKLD